MARTKLKDLPPEQAIAHVMGSVLEPYYKEGRKRVKADMTGRRAADAAERRNTEMHLNEASFKVLEAAAEHVSGGGQLPYSARRLFYAVRDMIRLHTTNEFSQDNGYQYFQSTILQDYQREHGKLEGLYYDPRGRLHEPHSGATLDVGTREVESYTFPKHRFNKLLYVEKKGQFPLLEQAKIMERYDIAIMTGEGYATEAARTLLSAADKDEKMQIFVLHDGDMDGYNIARKVRDATKRMPEYSVDVIDLGLTVTQALELELEPEEHTRKKEMDEDLVEELEETEPVALRYFRGVALKIRQGDKEKTIWEHCRRFELDKMTAPQAVALVKRGLEAEGVFGKVVPDEEALPDLAENIYRAEASRWADAALEAALGWQEIKRRLAERFIEEYGLEYSDRYIPARFKQDDSLSWEEALRGVLSDIHHQKHTQALGDAVVEELRKVRESLEEEE
ncbi:MAG: hypothetical protein H0W57_06055 [Rubrobacteraceae bacterium]|jgi:hypothetical protein|nr:hypothetical protein [Rubrobacter sp.]MBA3635967.1 hypothetical protein [Rubrobacteraceae bacterium]